MDKTYTKYYQYLIVVGAFLCSLFQNTWSKSLNVFYAQIKSVPSQEELEVEKKHLNDRAIKGFDYIDEKNTSVLWKGCLEGKMLGNAKLKKLSDNTSGFIKFGNGNIIHSVSENGEYCYLLCFTLKE